MPGTLRVLVLTPGVFDKGGIARYGRAQIRALRDAFGDRAVDVLSLVGRRDGDFEEPFPVSWAGPVPLSRGARVLFASVAAGYARSRPNVILTQHLHLGPLAWLLARMVRARLVQTVYGLELWSGLTRARRATLSHSDLVISDCHSSAEYCVEANLVSRPPVVIWDCVDLDRFTPGEASASALAAYGVLPRARFRILFLARLTRDARYKGAERLIALLARLPADRFEAVFAGSGDDIPHLRELAGRAGVADRTYFTGPIHEEHMPEIYRGADAFYLTSESGQGKGEGIPLTPLEALACGVPVVVGNQDGSREAIEGGGGICLDPGNLDGQAAYLMQLAADPSHHAAERLRGRKRAEEAFGYPAFAAKTREALLAVTNRAASAVAVPRKFP